jgi:hypothetical protein
MNSHVIAGQSLTGRNVMSWDLIGMLALVAFCAGFLIVVCCALAIKLLSVETNPLRVAVIQSLTWL